MGEVKLLDCTLRDGGYVNDWKFGHDNLVSIFERMVDSGIEIIEIGFLDERRPFDIDRSIMPDTDSVQKIYGELDSKQTMVVGMIDYGTCSIDHIKPCKDSYLDGIRVIFKKHNRREALKYCAQIKALGYKVFVQLVSITSYSDEEMMDLIQMANEVRPYAVSMVDTYGLLHQNNLMHYFNMLNEHLDTSIGIGYHAHNNFQMGYANCIAFLANEVERQLLVDGSIYGMGKSAGNAPIELVAMHMNNCKGKQYHISQILEAIDANVSQFYQSATWGYNMFYYLAAYNDCHPNYVSYLMNMRTLSVKSINEILGKLEGEKKLLYDKDYIDSLYEQYQRNEVDDVQDRERLALALEHKEVLLLGPGTHLQSQKDLVNQCIEEKEPLVISINFIPKNFEPDKVFISNRKRYVQLATLLSRKNYSVIATSNVTGTTEDAFEYVVNFSSLMDKDAEFIDNSLVMMLKLLRDLKVEKVYLAGFDGYSKSVDNYYNASMEYDFVKSKADYLNQYTRDFLKSIRNKIEIQFITDSEYVTEEER